MGPIPGRSATWVNYLAVVPLLSFHLCVDELVGRFHSIHVWLGIAGDHVVKLESEGEEPAVDIWGERSSRNIPVESVDHRGDTSREGSLGEGCWGGVRTRWVAGGRGNKHAVSHSIVWELSVLLGPSDPSCGRI